MFTKYVSAPILASLLLCNPPAPGQAPATEHQSRHQAAIADARQRTLTGPPTVGAMTQMGDALLRAGQCEAAIDWFEQSITADPSIQPHLWQYGIALYFVERYADGQQLFEQHRRVNPHDVENAAWHFLCTAKADGLEAAKELLLPAPDDPRVPMAQILARLAGGDQGEIDESVERLRGTGQFDDARFYGDLYLGLIADAQGDRAAAAKHLRSAARTKRTHYMADVARVYADRM